MRVERRYEADEATFRTLRDATASFGGRVRDELDAPIRILGATVHPGRETRVVESLNPSDEERILREVRNAARMADYVIVNEGSTAELETKVDALWEELLDVARSRQA